MSTEYTKEVTSMQSTRPTETSYLDQFDSLEEFYNYICSTPFNAAFRWSHHDSVDAGHHAAQWTGTETFDDAVLLLKRGWSDMAQKLVNKLKVLDKRAQPVQKRKPINAVAGYQPIVPLYLAGVPTSMVSHKMVPVKQKIVNLTKLFNYHAGISSEQIIEESVKVMQVVKKLEAQGYRVNVDVAFGSSCDHRTVSATIRIKSANERLNVSKLAFPLVHPSMLRRLMFRYIEVCPNVTSGYTTGYGRPCERITMQKFLPNSVVIPAIWDINPDKVSTIEDIKGVV